MDIGKTILSIRKELGLSQVQLAEKSELSQSFIAQLESGKSDVNITLNTLKRLSAALNISIPLLILESVKDEDIQEGKIEIFNSLKDDIREVIANKELSK
jgi:transcriptional regulator with XRE-family HTH domain